MLVQMQVHGDTATAPRIANELRPFIAQWPMQPLPFTHFRHCLQPRATPGGLPGKPSGSWPSMDVCRNSALHFFVLFFMLASCPSSQLLTRTKPDCCLQS